MGLLNQLSPRKLLGRSSSSAAAAPSSSTALVDTPIPAETATTERRSINKIGAAAVVSRMKMLSVQRSPRVAPDPDAIPRDVVRQRAIAMLREREAAKKAANIVWGYVKL
jgi:hypothetical protein